MSKEIQKHDLLRKRIKMEIESEPSRQVDKLERYRRMLESGVAATFQVILDAHTDRLADEALREHIATLIDQGRDAEMTTQLRAYAVRYLVYPIEIMRKRE